MPILTSIYRKASPWLASHYIVTSVTRIRVVTLPSTFDSNQDFKSVRRGCVSTASADDAGRGPWPWRPAEETGNDVTCVRNPAVGHELGVVSPSRDLGRTCGGKDARGASRA
jgi:hypothetical protein